MNYSVNIYYNKEDLPVIEDVNFFHYSSSFDWYSNTPTYKPFMLVAFNDDRPVAAMFAIIVRRNRYLRGSLFKRCFISQQPSFFDDTVSKIELFNVLISRLVDEVKTESFWCVTTGFAVVFLDIKDLGKTDFILLNG